MKKIKITEKQLALVEKLGVMFEGLGLPPAAARIESLLIVSDETELTFDEIRDTLNISKSAASNGINMLLLTKRIVYLTKSGDRKRYFRSNIPNWKDSFRERFEEMAKINVVMREVLAQRPDTTKEFNREVKDFIGLMELLNKQLPLLFKQWADKNK